MDYSQYISRDPKVCGGQPVIKGTRVTLRTVLASLAEGAEISEILADFPSVSEEAVRAVIAFAENVAAQLGDYKQGVSAETCEGVIPHEATGLYSIFVDEPGSLPEPFSACLRCRSTRLVYAGVARRSLVERLLEQDLRHRRASTFFRGIDAVLDFRPPAGSLRGRGNQNNYRFSCHDTKRIVEWMNARLRVRWVVLPQEVAAALEPYCIRTLMPAFNTTYNPGRLPELAKLRAACRSIALAGLTTDD